MGPEAKVNLGFETVFAGQGVAAVKDRMLGHCEEDDGDDCFDPEPACQDCFEADEDE